MQAIQLPAAEAAAAGPHGHAWRCAAAQRLTCFCTGCTAACPGRPDCRPAVMERPGAAPCCGGRSIQLASGILLPSSLTWRLPAGHPPSCPRPLRKAFQALAAMPQSPVAWHCMHAQRVQASTRCWPQQYPWLFLERSVTPACVLLCSTAGPGSCAGAAVGLDFGRPVCPGIGPACCRVCWIQARQGLTRCQAHRISTGMPSAWRL